MSADCSPYFLPSLVLPFTHKLLHSHAIHRVNLQETRIICYRKEIVSLTYSPWFISGSDPFPALEFGNMSKLFGHFVWELVEEMAGHKWMEFFIGPLLGNMIYCAMLMALQEPKEDYNMSCNIPEFLRFFFHSSSRVYFVFVHPRRSSILRVFCYFAPRLQTTQFVADWGDDITFPFIVRLRAVNHQRISLIHPKPPSHRNWTDGRRQRSNKQFQFSRPVLVITFTLLQFSGQGRGIVQ